MSFTLVKLGGATLQDQKVVEGVTWDLSLAREQGRKIAVVHGGGPAINEELTRRGITWEFFEGQRITTPQMMETIEMVLVGQVGRRIVKALAKYNCPAVGFSGTDARTLLCRRADNRLGHVGVVEEVNTQIFECLMKSDIVPVMAPIGVDAQSEALNVNADWAASNTAIGLKANRLFFLTDQDGILDKNGELIPVATRKTLNALIEDETVKGGMLTKVRTVLHALDGDVDEVVIANARRPGVLMELLSGGRVGTLCKLA